MPIINMPQTDPAPTRFGARWQYETVRGPIVRPMREG